VSDRTIGWFALLLVVVQAQVVNNLVQRKVRDLSLPVGWWLVLSTVCTLVLLAAPAAFIGWALARLDVQLLGGAL
jgi:hypothetical protein